MSKLKHTPGPWIIKDRNGPGNITCEVCYGKDDECITDGVYEMADARLIAAAPEMLDFLIQLYENDFLPDPQKQFTAKITKNIIEKATGQKIEDILK